MLHEDCTSDICKESYTAPGGNNGTTRRVNDAQSGELSNYVFIVQQARLNAGAFAAEGESLLDANTSR